MTANLAGVSRELIEDRWRTLTIGVDLHDGSEANSALWQRLDGSIRKLAGRMLHGVATDDEYSQLCQLEARVHAFIEDEVLAFALSIETTRAIPDPDQDPSGPAVAAAAVPLQSIRDQVEHAWRHERLASGLPAADEFSDAFNGIGRAVETIWQIDDFRASELARLDTLVGEAIPPVRREAERKLLEAVTAAAEQFAAEFPDAPLRKAA